MKKIIGVLFLFLFAAAAQAQQKNASAPLHVGIIYPLSTNGTAAPRVSNGLSLHAIAGVSREERAFAAAGVGLHIRENAQGILFSGVYNHVKGAAHGLQSAGMVNVFGKPSSGVAFAGLVNITHAYKGAQFAGIANMSGSGEGGVQFGGIVNVAEDADVQISGLVNVAKRVKGPQIGLINMADESDYPIGLINIIKNGDRHVGMYVDQDLTLLATLRSGGRVLYSVLGFGYSMKEDFRNHLAIEGGVGVHVFEQRAIRFNIEAGSKSLTDFGKGTHLKNHIRFIPEFYLGESVRIMAGPSVHYSMTDTEAGKKHLPASLWKDDFKSMRHAIHLGWIAGISVRL